ncbi:exo-alpha-sialidase [Dokdonella sp.]|uniref:exo-alpha-sialidase n=1 Tax=Dokdonella sp. TaxID=2291710 RepID=UPI003C4EA14E
MNRSLPVVVIDPLDGKQTQVYDELIFGGPSITRRLWVRQSTDDGASWTIPVQLLLGAPLPRQPTIISSFQSGPSLLSSPLGGYLLFHHFGGVSPSDIWRQTSADGVDWSQSTLVDLGWPNAGGAGAGSGFPSVVRDGATSLTMLYERFAPDGASPAGLYLSRSTDLGLTWSPQRTLVAEDVALGSRAMLAYRASDGRYLAAYTVSPESGDSRVVVKVTDDALSWAAPAVLEVQGDNRSPALVVMPDGVFVLLYATVAGNQGDLFFRRSPDGIAWGAEVRLTNSPDNFDSTPFGVAGMSTSTIELYWSRTADLSGFGGQIVRETVLVEQPDLVFESGFDE